MSANYLISSLSSLRGFFSSSLLSSFSTKSMTSHVKVICVPKLYYDSTKTSPLNCFMKYWHWLSPISICSSCERTFEAWSFPKLLNKPGILSLFMPTPVSYTFMISFLLDLFNLQEMVILPLFVNLRALVVKCTMVYFNLLISVTIECGKSSSKTAWMSICFSSHWNLNIWMTSLMNFLRPKVSWESCKLPILMSFVSMMLLSCWRSKSYEHLIY